MAASNSLASFDAPRTHLESMELDRRAVKTALSRKVARQELADALKGRSFRLIQKKLKRAQHWLSKSEIDDAQNMIDLLQAERHVEEVKNSSNAAVMRKALEKVARVPCRNAAVMRKALEKVASVHGLACRNPEMRIRLAHDACAVLRKADTIEEMTRLSQARLGHDAEAVERIYDRLQDLGVRRREVQTACSLSRLTRDGEDILSIKKLCAHGGKVGVAEPLLSKAQQFSDQREVDLALLDKIDSENLAEIDQARCVAEMAGASPNVLAAASKKISLLRMRSVSPADAHGRIEATLQISRTEVHERLGVLLSKVLAARSDILESCEQFEKLFAHRHSRFFSLEGQDDYGCRGGRPYFKPKGWARYSLHSDDFDETKDWNVAYHGTVDRSAVSIMQRGLCNPGKEGVAVLHGQAGSTSHQTIYTSPSIEYAAFPVYAQFFELDTNHWAQLVFQCRVRPGSFVERHGTLGSKYWPQDVQFDPNFKSLDGLEWLVEEPAYVRVTAFLIREFGPNVDTRSYGHLNSQVRDEGCTCERTIRLAMGCTCRRGPEYSWSALRAKHFRDCGWLIET